ncbi:hypothetical protein BDQ17DRAFT_1410444 [Cyathus striatus]|nr:hypothetical protein BDQ17DRAFT_1410444 [Cyathus striatus]
MSGFSQGAQLVHIAIWNMNLCSSSIWTTYLYANVPPTLGPVLTRAPPAHPHPPPPKARPPNPPPRLKNIQHPIPPTALHQPHTPQHTPHPHLLLHSPQPPRAANVHQGADDSAWSGVHWDLVREGLSGMRNLESLLLVYTGEGTGGWVLDPPSEDGWCFCLKELRIRMGYDVALLSFLQNQPTLRTLHIHPIECPPLLQPLPPAIHLPLLTTYDGTLSLLPLLLSHIVPPLTGIQLLIDINSTKDTTSLDTALSALRALSKVGKTLRGLSMHDIPDDWVAPFLSVVSKTCPYLRHLGVIPVSKETNLAQIQTPLFPLRNLTTLEMDLSLLFTPSSSSSHYSPSPTYTQHAPQLLTPVLRTIVAEMKTMRPSLVVLGVWVYGTRWRWMFKGHGGSVRAVLLRVKVEEVGKGEVGVQLGIPIKEKKKKKKNTMKIVRVRLLDSIWSGSILWNIRVRNLVRRLAGMGGGVM